MREGVKANEGRDGPAAGCGIAGGGGEGPGGQQWACSHL